MSALLSTFGIDWQLLLAQGVNFIILAIALTYLLYKPVLKMVRDREHVVAKGVADAKLAGEKLAKADGEALAKAKDAEATAASIVKDARDLASAERSRVLADADARAKALARDAQARAEEITARAKRESEKDIARLAVLAAEKVIAKHD